jgi:hypothetical protein
MVQIRPIILIKLGDDNVLLADPPNKNNPMLL